jgi:hypothetical protein
MKAERRLHPRYHTTWAVEIGSSDGNWFAATLSDISLASFAMSTSRLAVVRLASVGSLLLPGDPLLLRFNSGIEWPGQCAPFACRVRQVRRVAQESYVIGGEFGALTAAQLSALRQGVEALASRNTP